MNSRHESPRPLHVVVLAAFLPSLLLSGCTQAQPPAGPTATATVTAFSHADLDAVLREHVGTDGRVDYAALKKRPQRLEKYVAQLAAVSPDNRPELFTDAPMRLAYWINAYNASVIATVLKHYPIGSVKDVRGPALVSLFSDLAGFFRFQSITLGGEETNLHALENDVIRERFGEPRIHFAINCASVGCPRLRAAAWSPDDLESQLDDAAMRFFSEERNLRVDHGKQTVYLSSILKWFEDDFTTWLENRFPEKDSSLLTYVGLYVGEKRAEELRWAESSTDYRVEFLDYDWRLNGR